MTIQRVAFVSSVLLALLCGSVQAADRPLPGFYGGLTLRDQAGVPTGAMTLGIPATALSQFNTPVIDDPTSHTSMFGGYRFGNDVSVEAAVNASDPTMVRPGDPLPGARRGLGLVPSAASLGLTDIQSRTWNVDLYTGWNFYRNFSLYGRLGYAQSEIVPTPAMGLATISDPRRLRDGMNYGVGVRYNMSSALGLRLEYARLGRFAGEVGSTPTETDQVTFGLQFRF